MFNIIWPMEMIGLIFFLFENRLTYIKSNDFRFC